MTENKVEISFILNGEAIQIEIPPHLTLLSLIRENLSLRGTKPGCNEGECGACTVLIEGEAVNSCIYLALNIDGKDVVTVEGLSGEDQAVLDPVQEALIQHGAVQCGFCTPGMVMSIKSFLGECEESRLVPDRDAIKKNLEGNLCRCTGYVKIVDAVESLVPATGSGDTFIRHRRTSADRSSPPITTGSGDIPVADRSSPPLRSKGGLRGESS